MDNILFGEIIRTRREELQMSQDELCEGVCTRSTLSRIETGRNECRKYIAEILLERLNLPVEVYLSLRDATEFEQIKIKNQINTALRTRAYEKLPALIEKGRQFINDDKLYEQFLMREEATYLITVKKEYAKAKDIIIRAIRLIHNGFEIDKMDKMFLTKEDIYLLNVLGNIFVEENNHETAIYIFGKLIEKVMNRPDNDESEELAKIKVMLYSNYSRALGRADYYKECLDITEKGIEVCDKINRIQSTIDLYMNKGYALCAMRRKEEGTLILKDALLLCKIVKNCRYMEIIKRDAKELFDIVL